MSANVERLNEKDLFSDQEKHLIYLLANLRAKDYPENSRIQKIKEQALQLQDLPKREGFDLLVKEIKAIEPARRPFRTREIYNRDVFALAAQDFEKGNATYLIKHLTEHLGPKIVRSTETVNYDLVSYKNNEESQKRNDYFFIVDYSSCSDDEDIELKTLQQNRVRGELLRNAKDITINSKVLSDAIKEGNEIESLEKILKLKNMHPELRKFLIWNFNQNSLTRLVANPITENFANIYGNLTPNVDNSFAIDISKDGKSFVLTAKAIASGAAYESYPINSSQGIPLVEAEAVFAFNFNEDTEVISVRRESFTSSVAPSFGIYSIYLTPALVDDDFLQRNKIRGCAVILTNENEAYFVINGKFVLDANGGKQCVKEVSRQDIPAVKRTEQAAFHNIAGSNAKEKLQAIIAEATLRGGHSHFETIPQSFRAEEKKKYAIVDIKDTNGPQPSVPASSNGPTPTHEVTLAGAAIKIETNMDAKKKAQQQESDEVVIEMEAGSGILEHNDEIEEQVSLPYVPGSRVSYPTDMPALRKVRDNSPGMYLEGGITDILHPNKSKKDERAIDPFTDHGRGLKFASRSQFETKEELDTYLSSTGMESLNFGYDQGIARLIAHLLSQGYNKSSSFIEAGRVISDENGVVFPILGAQRGFRATGVGYGLTLPIPDSYGMIDTNPEYYIPGEIFVRAKNSPKGGADIISSRTSNQLMKAILEYTPIRNADGTYTYSSLKVYDLEIIDDNGRLNTENLKQAIKFAKVEEKKSEQELDAVRESFKTSMDEDDILKNIFLLTEAHRIKPGEADENGEISPEYVLDENRKQLAYTLDRAMAIAIFRDLPLVLQGIKDIADCPALIDAMVWCGDPELSAAIRQSLEAKIDANKINKLVAKYGSGDSTADLAQSEIESNKKCQEARAYYVQCLKAYKDKVVVPALRNEGKKESDVKDNAVIRSGVDFLSAANSAVKEGNVNKDDLTTIFEFQAAELHDCMKMLHVEHPPMPKSLAQSRPTKDNCKSAITNLAKEKRSLAAKAFVAVATLLAVTAFFAGALALTAFCPPAGLAFMSFMAPVVGPTMLTAGTAAIATLGYVASMAIGCKIEDMHQERGLKACAPKAVKAAIAVKEKVVGGGRNIPDVQVSDLAEVADRNRNHASIAALTRPGGCALLSPQPASGTCRARAGSSHIITPSAGMAVK